MNVDYCIFLRIRCLSAYILIRYCMLDATKNLPNSIRMKFSNFQPQFQEVKFLENFPDTSRVIGSDVKLDMSLEVQKPLKQ